MLLVEGKHGTTLIDDTYNSSPVAAHAALDVLRTLEVHGRRIAALGDMLELGEHEEREHRALGEQVATFADMLVTVGRRAQFIADAARAKGMPGEHIHEFETSDEAGAWLASRLKTGDVVLFKGSQGSGVNKVRMERALKQCLSDPSRASDLLVRQEPEWEIH
jgi:UDP-N-acetylmuramoyl-tripeptide--D-alanyl-D-alanine ligase